MMRNSIPCFGIIRIRCKGFDLSLSFNPQADKAPLLVSAAKIGIISICQAKKDFPQGNLNIVKPQQKNTNTRKLPPPRH